MRGEVLEAPGSPARHEAPVLREALPLNVRRDLVAESLLPQTVLGWIPFWWSRVLFPGRVDARPAGIGQTLLLILVPAVLLYPFLSFFLFEPDEGRYAQIPREMLQAGEWIVPTLQGEPYLDKPPLFYWLVMLSYAVFGYHDWAARLIPALATHGTILLCFFLGRRIVGTQAAFWGSLLLSAAGGFVGISRLLVLDGLFTFCVTLALFAGYLARSGPRLHRGWWTLGAVACGLGVLTKGPAALILVVVPCLFAGRLQTMAAPVSWRALLSFAGIVAALNAPWYVSVAIREPEFARYFFWQHNVQRFVDPFDHERPIWFFLPLTALFLIPGSLFLWGATRFLISSDPQLTRCRPLGLGFLLLAGLWCVAFFSLSGSKLPTYILPALPPLALALGCYIAASGWAGSLWWRWGMAFWLGLIVFCHGWVAPRIATLRSPAGRLDQVRAWCADPSVPVYCFPRPVDSVAFYVGRSDFASFRSKNIAELIEKLEGHDRAVVLFSHRHSIDLLRLHLPSTLRMADDAPLGLCRMAKIERVR